MTNRDYDIIRNNYRLMTNAELSKLFGDAFREGMRVAHVDVDALQRCVQTLREINWETRRRLREIKS